ncbi:glycosyltransferase [Chloroflexota bacterium]
MDREYGRFRKEIDAPLSKRSQNPQLILLPMSPYVVNRGTNWTVKNVMSGFWYLSMPLNYSPPRELEDFIQQGERPIFISFGSAGWSEEHGGTLMETLFNAVINAKVRAVIIPNSDIKCNNVPSSICLINDVPYDWMFSKVSCVVHHCGLGTTAEVLKAGIPSVPVPHIIDQFRWAKRVYSLGVATRPIPRKQLTTGTLSQAITQALENREFRKNTYKLAKKLQKEDGLQSAVEAIEHIIQSNRNGTVA